jgi:hypothetical protein
VNTQILDLQFEGIIPHDPRIPCAGFPAASGICLVPAI